MSVVINQDNMEWLSKQSDNSIDLIITSPPYNLGNKKGGNVVIDTYKDNLNNGDYETKQIEFLNECYRVLKPKGALFYNHKNRYDKGKLVVPYKWIFKSKLNIKQEIIWNRVTTADREASKFAPLDEKIFWLYKDKTFRLRRGAQNFTNIWEIKRPKVSENMGHKATFPYELIYRIINSLDVDKDITILDPYCGTGTTLHVANNLGFQNNIGIEYEQKWIDIIKEKANTKNDFFEKIPSIKNSYKKTNGEKNEI